MSTNPIASATGRITTSRIVTARFVSGSQCGEDCT